jgi:hypothetical protein
MAGHARIADPFYDDGSPDAANKPLKNWRPGPGEPELYQAAEWLTP